MEILVFFLKTRFKMCAFSTWWHPTLYVCVYMCGFCGICSHTLSNLAHL